MQILMVTKSEWNAYSQGYYRLGYSLVSVENEEVVLGRYL